MVSQQLPTGPMCNHLLEDTSHAFQLTKGYDTWGRIQRVLHKCSERNKPAPKLLSEILHGISEWQKGKFLTKPPSLPLTVDRAFEN